MTPLTATFESWDGASLFYRSWLPAAPVKKALVLFHRGHEHSARWQETVEALGLEDVAIFAWDARGHGESPGERGSAENLGAVVRDAEWFVRHITRAHGFAQEDMVVVAHSVGAVIAATWVHDFAPRIRGLVLAAPAFEVKLYVPFAIPLLRLKQRLFGAGYVRSYVKSKFLTHDVEQQKRYDDDTAIFKQIAVNILLDLFDTSKRVAADSGAIITPTLMLAAGADWIVKNTAQRRFFDGLSSKTKRFEILPGFYHAVFHEKDRRLVTDKIREFVVERFADPSPPPSLTNGDKQGYTRNEYDRLRQPGPFWWGIQRFIMRSIACLSDGILLGWGSGFDSGRTLDYVYENKPRGFTWLGRLIDKNYLNSIGWRGIRVRRENLECMLRETIQNLHAAGRAVRILDIATGCGRYVLETMKAMSHVPATAVLRDYKTENVEAGRQLAESLGVRDATIVQGDAFDRASLAAVTPKPTVGIVSGLYELYPENDGLRRSLRGLADAIEPGGYLIYTNQPWHPQVEFIARALTNREGQPWVMRRRTQMEMDQLVAEAGFDKVDQKMDKWGIFTVSVAKRRDS